MFPLPLPKVKPSTEGVAEDILGDELPPGPLHHEEVYDIRGEVVVQVPVDYREYLLDIPLPSLSYHYHSITFSGASGRRL